MPPVPGHYQQYGSRAASPSAQSGDDDEEDDEGRSGIAGGSDFTGSPSASGGPKKAQKGAKRQRVHFSCTECHRRKQKCNRQTPCQHCIARKVPERCKTFAPGQDEGIDLAARVNRLEKTVEEGFDRILGILKTQHGGTAATQSHQALPGPSRPSAPVAKVAIKPPTARHAGVFSDGSDVGDEANDGAELNASGEFHGSGATVAMRIDSLLSGVTTAEGVQSGTSTSGGHVHPTLIAVPMRSEPGAGDHNPADFDSRLTEIGASGHISAAFTAALPPREVCRELIDHFFRDINWIRHPIPEKLLRPEFEKYLAPHEGSNKYHTPLSTSNVNVFACLLLVLAMSVMSTDSDAFPKQSAARRLAARKFEFTGRRTLLLSQVLGRDDILQVLGFNLAWRFLMLDRRMNEAWRCSSHSITAGFAIGLHRDGSKLGLSPLETDLRRCVWASIVFADLFLAGTLGRPPISDLDRAYTDTQNPTLEGMKHWWPFEDRVSHPKAKAGVPMPTIYQHVMQRESVTTRACEKIVEIYQKLTPHHYSDVLAADAELIGVPEKLPHYHRVSFDSEGNVHCDRSLDNDMPYVRIHRFLIHTELHFARIALHRSYLLRSGAKGPSGQRFIPSRKACVDSAMKDLAMRADFVQQLRDQYGPDNIPLLYYFHIGTFAWFNSLLIACVAALLEPGMPEIPTLRVHLERFLKRNEAKKQGQTRSDLEGRDEVRDREATILNMFLQAIDRAQAAQSTRSAAAAAAAAAADQGDNGSRGRKRGRSPDSSGPSTGSKATRHKSRDQSATRPRASREETTADVLLDLGKGDNRERGTASRGEKASSQRDSENHKGGEVSRSNGAGSSHKAPSSSDAPHQHHHGGTSSHTAPHLHQPSHAGRLVTSPSEMNFGDQAAAQRNGLGDSSSYGLSSHPTMISSVTSSSPAVDSPGNSVGQSSAAGGAAGSTPSGLGGGGGPGSSSRSSRLVDSAQADFNAWFQMEFAGGAWPLADNSLNDFAVGTEQPGGTAGVATSLTGGLPGQLAQGNAMSGWFPGVTGTQQGGYGAENSFALSAPYSAPASTTATTTHQQQQQRTPVQWSTLPRPTWESGASGSDITTSFGGGGGGGGGQANDAATVTTKPGADVAAGVGAGGIEAQDGPFLKQHFGASAPESQQHQFVPSNSQQQQQQQSQQQGVDPGTANAGGDSFDPGFWADLINKIST